MIPHLVMETDVTPEELSARGMRVVEQQGYDRDPIDVNARYVREYRVSRIFGTSPTLDEACKWAAELCVSG